MTAQKIDGTAIARSIREKIHADIQEKQQTNPRYKPSLVIVQGICREKLNCASPC
jgi:methylenetetrahydrofolate dehydrogenase (NADP+)/methenyltetrahydrofolate cyclohydrolase/formyltetrahydrofolate synthetase